MSDNVHIVTGSSSKKSGDNKWMIFAIPILVMVSLFFTVLLTSGKLTNQKTLAGGGSQKKVVTVTPASAKSNSTSSDFQQQEPVEEGLNTFVMVGAFVKVEPGSRLIYITGKSGKTYVFRIDEFLRQDEQTWLNVYIVSDLKTLNTAKIPDLSGFAPEDDSGYLTESFLYNLTDPESTKGLTEIAIRWNDSRAIGEIVDKYNKDPQVPLNEFFPRGVALAKFK